MAGSGPKTSLGLRALSPIVSSLRRANAAAAKLWPGEPQGRQPVHTVYGGAHLFRSDAASRLGSRALAALNEYAPDAAALSEALQLESHPDVAALMPAVYERVVRKLRSDPVEDLRIDFEDGYGLRSNDE